MRHFFLLLAAALCALPAMANSDKTIDDALGSAIKEAMAVKEEGYPSPYYVAITATKSAYNEDDCQMGEIEAQTRQRQSFIVDDVRVGSYGLDNYPLSAPGQFLGSLVNLDDPFALRYALWRALDSDYKNAAAGFLRKEALLAVRGKTEYDTDDMSRETPRLHAQDAPPLPWSDEQIAAACRQASSVFRKAPGLLSAQSSVIESDFWSYLQDSEGSKINFGGRYAQINLSAAAIAPDGLDVHAERHLLSVSGADFPPQSKIKSEAASVLSDIALLQKAKAASPFDAPAILDPSVAGAVIQALGERLFGENQRDPNGAQIFRGKIGTAILPADLSLEDDPTLADFGDTPLAGHYDYDSQGMPAQKVVLIENGVLRNFLLSRHPVIGFPHSNGHGRSAPGFWTSAVPGSLILKTSRPLSREQMASLLRDQCRKLKKPYGFFAQGLIAFSQNQGTSDEGSIRIICEMVYRVSARTGRMTLVRNLDLIGTPLSLMNNIMGLGDDAQAINTMENGVPISIVTPSLLLSDIETQRSNQSPEKGPILPPPSAQADP